MIFGKDLVKLLLHTAEQLAEKSGIHYKKITDYENNYIRFENVTVGNALKLAKALGVTLDELCNDENEIKE